MVLYQIPGKNSRAYITLNIFVFTIKGAGFGTPEHAIKSLFPCFKNWSNFKFDCFKSPEIMSMSRKVPFDLTCEVSDVISEKLLQRLFLRGASKGK